uniref:EGF-like domain-containing protein n=1 Tax=Strigamia maritima TaxID=126957 RepID=T1IUN6_STRMM
MPLKTDGVNSDVFRCRDGQIIPSIKVCNKLADCIDGSDENNFTMCGLNKSCLPQEFTCSNGKCVSLIQICNKVDDCGDGSDEVGCSLYGRCENANCQQRCISLSTGGHMCHCSSGFRLSSNDKLRCDDVDECAQTRHNFCPQNCHNTIGSFNCSCANGYIQSEYKCLATGFAEVLIYANGPALLALHQGMFRYFIASDANITAMDVDTKEGMIYWVNSNNYLKRSFVPNATRTSPPSGLEQVLARVRSRVTSISVDWIARNLYWAEIIDSKDQKQGLLSVSSLDGRYKMPLIFMSSELVLAVAVNPEIRWVYWTSMGKLAQISAAWMDGTNRFVVVNSSLVAPTGLTIDYHHMRHRIYWSDAMLNRIESANWDGTDRIIIATGDMMGFPGKLDVFGSTLYWAPRNISEVRRVDKFGRGVHVTVSKHAQPITDFKVYQTVKYNLQGSNPCKDAGCSHLCLLTPVGAKCGCPEGTSFQPNSTLTCAAIREQSRPDPFKCLCLNGGLCRVYPSGEVSCQCPSGYQGNLCEIQIPTHLSG